MPFPQLQLLPSPSTSSLTHKPSLDRNPINPDSKGLSLTPSLVCHHCHNHRRRKHIPLRCSASSFSEKHHTGYSRSDDVVELPLFPLPLAFFPAAVLLLQIFEFRYRMMMHPLLQTDLRFGVIYSDTATGTADVGCVGQERFGVTKLVRTKPFGVAEVTRLEDRPSADGEEDVEALPNEVETNMEDVSRLSDRLNGKPEKGSPDLRHNLFPTLFPFFVGSAFEGAPREQQALLELEDTAMRLKREKETLRNTLNYLTAALAVKDVFPSS